MHTMLMAMDPRDRRRFAQIIRPKDPARSAERLEEEIRAIEGHIARLREIAAEEYNQEVTGHREGGDHDTGSPEQD